MKTNLKQFRWIIALIAMLPASGFAQTEADKVNERLEKIESKLLQQESTINSLRQEIEAVTKQNLALKQNLNLTPTIAKAKMGENMEFRVLEVTGDPDSKDVKVVISGLNNGVADKDTHFIEVSTVDELGNGYDDDGRVVISIPGVEENLIKHSAKFHSNSPYTMNMTIKKYNPEAQYIKHLDITLLDGIKHVPVTFENLPIKWVSNE